MKRAAFTVTVLGSGTGIPDLNRSGPAYYLQRGKTTALIDCGNGTVHQLLRAGKSYQDLDAVFITHAHPDHLCDLIPLLHALQLDSNRRSPLHLYGPPGFCELLERLLLPLVGEPERFEVRAVDATRCFRWADCAVLTAETRHSTRLRSLAYRFEADRRSVVFSGDADDDPGLLSLVIDADLLVLDCSFPDELKVEGHLTAGECGRLAAGAGVSTVLLSHLYPTGSGDEAALRRRQCRTYFAGAVQVAEDLMELRV